MKFVLAALVLLMQTSSKWEPSFENALIRSKTEHKLILLNFSGSDWCGPCIRMRKEILDDSTFNQLADEKLIMVNADFPRMKKNQPNAPQLKRNEALAENIMQKVNFPTH